MPRIIFILIAIILGAHGALFAAEPQTTPILRIEAGAHTAMITGSATDANGRFVATASYDKTARLYEVATGRLLRTFRPPIGSVHEGRLDAVALSPDGATLALGGWTGYEWEDNIYIYLFDTSSGKLVRRISVIPEVITHLAFSADGRNLAAAIHENSSHRVKTGIRLYRLSDGAEIGRDTDYGGSGNSVNFSADGRLVSSCDDGFIRLYDRIQGNNQLRLIVKTKPPGGAKPSDARFSPNGARIAVGYSDSPEVDVLSSSDLSLIFRADTNDVSNGALSSVAWSADGSSLYAGGSNRERIVPDRRSVRPVVVEETVVRRWSSEGRGNAMFPVGATGAIMGLAPLPDGSLLAGTSDPALVFFGQRGQRRFFAEPPIADYSGMQEGLQIAADGSEVSFGYKRGGKAPHSFALAGRMLTALDKAVAGSALQPPITSLPGITITGWENNTEPELNGARLVTAEYETSRSLAISSNGSRFLLGTSWYLRCYSRSGDQLWEKAVPASVWGVNIAPNGRVAVAAYGDGTIRWHRLSDGKELLAFFPHADRKRWVLWTPEGFFDHSPGGEELIGWHLNRGKDKEAEFIPVGKLYNQFYRPDLIDAAFEGKDLSEYAKAINIDKLLSADTLPPKVRLLTQSGKSGGHDTAIKAELCDNGGGIGDITLYLNGMPVMVSKGGRGLRVRAVQKGAAACSIFEHTVTLSDGNNEISLMAYNKAMTVESNRDSIKLSYVSGIKAKPDLHILTVAVNSYRDGDLQLSYSVPDAKAIADSFKGKGDKLFGKIFVHQLFDAQVTKAGLEKAFAEIGKQTGRDDVFVLFVAGHGITGIKDGAYYFIPYDFRYTGEDAVIKQGVSMDDFKGYLANVNALKSLILLDTCNSGSFAEAITSRGMVEKTAINKLARAVGRATIVASSKSQVALEGYEGHGAFTWTLLDGLKGKAADGSGKITINGLATYVEELLPQITYKKWGFEQIPQKNLQGMDFPIGLR
jgi:WD40 repeat protein